jgi:hypothetical protein
MKAVLFVITVMISLFLVSATVPGVVAEESLESVREEMAKRDLPPNIAIAYVLVTVVEWEPDLEGVGAGLFTDTEFDFSGFFEELGESLASLFGL